MKSDRQKTYEKFRTAFPFMVYEGFSYSLTDRELCIVFEFNLADRHSFRPEIRISHTAKIDRDIISDSLIRNIIFNMGMVELISYWKAACPPGVIIRAGNLSPDQAEWWKKLYLNGLGEFFYENGIKPGPDFMDITAEPPEDGIVPETFSGSGILVPVGGGKDSVVTLELLSEHANCRPFIVNPREASVASVRNAGYREEDTILMYRSIDPLLIELNGKGFLNGHTPFSAMLAFSSLLVASIYGLKEIALSNESSANDPTIPGTKINHQYSKSLEFEEDFRMYVSKYLCTGINYYSFLRPLNELQISGLFSTFHHHFSSFKSCNIGSKTDSWCGKCPKCLFTYIMLSVFLTKETLLGIFGKDMYEDSSLLFIFDQLTGLADEKPFECVGTTDEVNIAVRRTVEKLGPEKLPVLLKHYHEQSGLLEPVAHDLERALADFGPHHIPGDDMVKHLKSKVDAL
ncbi:MAG: hypothetical protein V2I47_12895 [Bacteroidales bacterium]|jgi:hypothetical protein|nr:hypothetical protein [Bacteroidales bacterium]